MKLSDFGQRYGRSSGITELMDDLGIALRERPEAIFMGGGNPAHLPELERQFQHRLEAVLQDPQKRHELFGIYASPEGDPRFREQLAQHLNRELGWSVAASNIAVTNGSQSAFFVLFNLFAGAANGASRRVHLPVVPEYIGYADLGLTEDFFSATQPSIELVDGHTFKYHVDFSELTLGDGTGEMCVSRPTNPTGNVLTDAEMTQLGELARKHDVPFIVDGAYGLPFPNILFTEATTYRDDNTVVVLSLSKLGLPGTRTGIVIASEEIVDAFCNASTVISLATGTLGPAIAAELLAEGSLTELCNDQIQPFYRQRMTETVAATQAAFNAKAPDVPWRIHVPEGAFFLWLWLEGLPISSRELYQRLKARDVLVVPGEPFFIGVDKQWSHQRECLRVSYAQDADTVARGLQIIAEEAQRAYAS